MLRRILRREPLPSFVPRPRTATSQRTFTNTEGPARQLHQPCRTLLGRALSVGPALWYLLHGDVGGAMETVTPEGPEDFISPLPTEELGRGSELPSKNFKSFEDQRREQEEIQNALPGSLRPQAGIQRPPLPLLWDD